MKVKRLLRLNLLVAFSNGIDETWSTVAEDKERAHKVECDLLVVLKESFVFFFFYKFLVGCFCYQVTCCNNTANILLSDHLLQQFKSLASTIQQIFCYQISYQITCCSNTAKFCYQANIFLPNHLLIKKRKFTCCNDWAKYGIIEEIFNIQYFLVPLLYFHKGFPVSSLNSSINNTVKWLLDGNGWVQKNTRAQAAEHQRCCCWDQIRLMSWISIQSTEVLMLSIVGGFSCETPKTQHQNPLIMVEFFHSNKRCHKWMDSFCTNWVMYNRMCGRQNNRTFLLTSSRIFSTLNFYFVTILNAKLFYSSQMHHLYLHSSKWQSQ